MLASVGAARLSRAEGPCDEIEPPRAHVSGRTPRACPPSEPGEPRVPVLPHPVSAPPAFLASELSIGVTMQRTEVPRVIFYTTRDTYQVFGLEERVDGTMAFSRYTGVKVGLFGQSDVGGNVGTLTSRSSTFAGGARIGPVVTLTPDREDDGRKYTIGAVYEASGGYSVLPTRAASGVPTAGAGDRGSPGDLTPLAKEAGNVLFLPYRGVGLSLWGTMAGRAGSSWSYFVSPSVLAKRRSYDTVRTGDLVREAAYGGTVTFGVALRPVGFSGGLQAETELGTVWIRRFTRLEGADEEAPVIQRSSLGFAFGPFYQSNRHAHLRASLSGFYRCGITPSAVLGAPPPEKTVFGCGAPAASQMGALVTLRYIFG